MLFKNKVYFNLSPSNWCNYGAFYLKTTVFSLSVKTGTAVIYSVDIHLFTFAIPFLKNTFVLSLLKTVIYVAISKMRSYRFSSEFLFPNRNSTSLMNVQILYEL